MENLDKIPEIRAESSIEKEPEVDSMIVVVKPDARQRLKEIISRFEKEGLRIEKQVTTMLDPTFVNGIMYQYPHPESDETIDDIKFVKNRGAQFESVKHFMQGPSTILLLKGDKDIIDKVVKITGQERDPAKCSVDSIRYIFGEHEGYQMAGLDDMYFRNAIHRGKNTKEVEEDKEKFSKLLRVNFFE